MNRIQDISELEKLESLPNLIELSLVGNAVARRLLHRPMLVFRMQTLMIIDGIPVSDEERTKAELYFIEQQIPQQMTTTVETTLPGIGQYKAQIPVKVTNVQLASPPERVAPLANYYKEEDVPQNDKGRRQRGSGRTDNGQPLTAQTRSGTTLYHMGNPGGTHTNNSRSQYQFQYGYQPGDFANQDRHGNNRNNRR